MRKRTIISSFLVLIVIFSMSFRNENIYIKTERDNQPKPISSDALGDPIGDSEIFAQFTNTEFILDGNLSDWEQEGIKSELLSNVNVYLAYDSNYVYIGLTWADSTFSDSVFTWNKTGMIDEDDADWEIIDGEDDIVSMGFAHSDNISKGDFWTWTASNRTHNGYVFEHDYGRNPDTGLTPYLINTNTTENIYWNAKPVYYNNWTPITNYSAIPNFTTIDGWYNEGLITPSASQADVSMNWTYSNEQYIMEFKRPLNTSKTDDCALDFVSDELTFYLEISGSFHTVSYNSFNFNSFKITITNNPAELTFDTMPSEISLSLLITGEVYDDFGNIKVRIECSGWNDTYGPNSYDYASIDLITGSWSFLFFYDNRNMPIGTNNITITLNPMYEDPIILWQLIDIEDTYPPHIYGVTNITDWYPKGIPLNIDKVTITIGIDDTYCDTDDLKAYLYYYKGDDVLSMVEMTQFSILGRTFSGNFSVEHDIEIDYLYFYYVEVFDVYMNKVTTTKLNFTSIAGIYTPIQTGSENSHIVYLPTLEIALAAMALITIIGKANKKKRK